MISYFVAFGILVVKKNRVDKRVSKDRVKKHREDKKALGYKTITVELNPIVFERLQRFKEQKKLTYAEVIELLLPVLK